MPRLRYRLPTSGRSRQRLQIGGACGRRRRRSGRNRCRWRIAIAWSKSRRSTASTGPKISSWAEPGVGATSAKMCGPTNSLGRPVATSNGHYFASLLAADFDVAPDAVALLVDHRPDAGGRISAGPILRLRAASTSRGRKASYTSVEHNHAGAGRALLARHNRRHFAPRPAPPRPDRRRRRR